MRTPMSPQNLARDPKRARWPSAGGGSVAAAEAPPARKKAVVIGVMAFAIMNFTTVVSLRGLPAEAEYGLTSIFYFIFAAIVALIPVALGAAELAAPFPQQGGGFW